ncbi:MAG TPA: protein-glutamate O-methyltransferase CheR [Pseudobdellovibrionaceae bacterium]|nr:protein-glutamate O-methyltransferase CheR [Pseudobdellovibrionaceae bacterium]
MSSSAAIKNIFASGNMELSEKTYEKFQNKIYILAGVSLPFSPKNHSLLKNRLSKVIRNHNMNSYEQYWEYLEIGDESVINEFISTMTTNMTSFFRESAHFDFFKRELPKIVKSNSEIRIWCAAASTGQEPYTIALSAAEVLQPSELQKIKILATDIDLEVLKKASKAIYNTKEVEGLTEIFLNRYFDHSQLNNENYYRVKKEIHKLIHFAPFNLISSQYSFKSGFHFIFCRNVLIYFDKETTQKVIENLTKCLGPTGILFLGHSESGNVQQKQLTPLQQAVFQKRS